MTQTPTELLAPYKAAVVAAVRDLLRVSSSAAIRFEIPDSVPPCLIVIGEETDVGKLLRATSREPMLGGRRAGDVPASPLTWEEPGAGPRSWTLLLAADGSGVAGKLGSKFEPAAPQMERVDVIEAKPVLEQLGELQRENAAQRRVLEDVRRAGGLMANTMFNLGQRSGTVVDQRLADSMRNMQRDWDAALRAAPKVDQQGSVQEGGAS